MDQKLTFILLGHTGAGKSASGNTILGEVLFESRRAFKSVTTQISEKSKVLYGKQISVIDTPGILCPGFEDKIKTYCQALLQSSTLCLFLVVIKIDRFTDEQKNAVTAAMRVIGDQEVSKADCLMLEYLPKMFGSYASKYSMVLFTHADQLNGQSLEDVIQSNEHVSKMVSMCANRYCVFDNKKRSNRLQVRSLLDKVDQILRTNGGHCPSDKLKFEPFKNKDGFFQTLVQLIKWLIMKIKELLASVVEYGFQSTRVIQHTALASIGMRRSIQSPLQSRVSPCSSLNVL
uniref:AIG1-type G domain-containing protein n=1 Tax=Amphilophus citrinellus TaxID=61819 RepID=A0A3Q0RMB1_AMPCI